jgi:hypothetical protein
VFEHFGRRFWPDTAETLERAFGYSVMGLVLIAVSVWALDDRSNVLYLFEAIKTGEVTGASYYITLVIFVVATSYSTGKLARQVIRFAYERVPRSWKSTRYRQLHSMRDLGVRALAASARRSIRYGTALSAKIWSILDFPP